MAKGSSGSGGRGRAGQAAEDGRAIRQRLIARTERRNARGLTGANVRRRYERRAQLAFQRGDYANVRRMMQRVQNLERMGF